MIAKAIVECHVAPSQRGHGIRLRLYGTSSTGVWFGQGWAPHGTQQAPPGAEATGAWGFQWKTEEEAETALRELLAEQGQFIYREQEHKS